MAKPYEQEVILDADGKSLFNAMEQIERRLNGIQKVIQNIHNESFKSAKDFSTTLDVNIKALQKSMAQMRALNNIGATERRQQLALAKSQADRDKSKYGDSTRARYQYDLEQKILRLRYAANEEERLAGLNAVRLAEARLAALTKIEGAERRIANEQRRRTGTDELTVHRQQLALSRQYATEQARSLGATEALARQKGLVLAAEQRLATASVTTANNLRRTVELENARLRALQRVAAQEQKNAGLQTRSGGGGPPRGPESRIANILSPGYAGAAFARTSVYGAAAAVAYGLFTAVSQAATGVVQLEDALFKLQAISNSTDTQMQSLKGTILALGKESRFSLQDLAEAGTILAQAGVSAGQMESVLRSVTTLATASGSTIDEAAQLVTSAIGSFQLQSSEAGRVADLMVNALNRTKLTVQQTAQAIQYVGATAYEQNISLEQLLATIGAVAQAGVRSGSTIGTGFRQFLVDLADPSKKLSEQLELLGLKASDVNVAVKGLPAVLETLAKAGFGAAQAYEGLEVRAAAFYLVAKNNVEIMDQLQLSFATQGAAATANERAMSSLAAQWQRFKNILQAGIARDLADTMAVLADIVRKLGDRIAEMQRLAMERRSRQAKGREGYAPGFRGSLQHFEETDYITPVLAPAVERLLNGQILPGDRDLTGWGTALRNLGAEANKAADANERLRTSIANSNDKITEQRGKITELDKELLRLIVQKESLRDNEIRTATETATLSSKFDGLAQNLGVTGNAYDSLVEAMKRYRRQQMELLGTDLNAQESRLSLEKVRSRVSGQQVGAALLRQTDFINAGGGASFANAITTANTAAPGSRAFLNAVAQLNDISRKFSASGQIEFARKLNVLIGEVSKVATNTAEIRGLKLQRENETIGRTEVGTFLTDTMREVEAAVTRISSMSNDEPQKAVATREALTKLSNMDNKIAEVLKRSLSDPARRFLINAQADVASLRTQVNALNAPTSDEKKEASAAAREAQRGPPLTQSQLDNIASKFLGAGFSLGSGVRSAAEQNRLHAMGLTPATAGTSAHSNGGLARDFRIGPEISDAQARLLAQSLRQHFKNLGVDVFVQFESGKGRNQGTGRHIHTSARRGTRWKGSAAGSDAAALDQFQAEMDTAQLGLDKREFNEALKDLAKSSDAAGMASAIARAKAAMEKVNGDLSRDAQNDIAKAGIGPGMPQYQARIDQLRDEINQNTEEFQRKLVEAIIKASQAMLKTAQEAFENALKPSQRQVALSEGAVSGLGYASISNRVPDYTRQLAEQQTARAREAADRARLNALPGLIEATQGSLNNLINQRDTNVFDQAGLDAINLQIKTLQNNLEDLVTTRDALNAAFGAEGLLPQTVGQGLQQALDAFIQLNGAQRNFTEMLNGEMGTAVGALHQNLTALFTTVMDGSQSAGQAVLGFAKAMIQAVLQIVAKIIATKIIALLGNLFGSPSGAFTGGAAGTASGATTQGFTGPAAFRGKRMYSGGPVEGYAGGGHVDRGHSMRDNVLAMLAKGEWVVNKRAVDSVGHEFMANLNHNGKRALDSAGSMPSLSVNPVQKVNVWVVKPDEKPQMGPDDVLVTWQNDVLQGGQSRRLIETISRESK